MSICIYAHLSIYWWACSLSSTRIDLSTVITCEYSQREGQTALLLASKVGHADTVRVLVELGASVEAVDKVNITRMRSQTRAVSSMWLGDEDDDDHDGSCVCMYIGICIQSHVYMYIHKYVCIFI